MASKRISEKKLVMSPGAGNSPSTRKAALSQRPARSTASVVAPGVDAPREPVAGTFPLVDPQAIAALAHSYWVARGCEGGSPEEDWLRAERELRVSGRVASATA
jgi:hypothetical protein